ncbi:NAD(P)-dependent oxidoreductase [Paracraurococcus lichenis]|uniref:NAD(P)-dependent oxidoreductase n=1 Tax=Paracraurococcus lichenis TaxID=3064888 RepID=A0ABT9ECG8_9PROT|nr:NAD(P)-dependent oxidoreductase [Paracraurococcus sp. LOR1-02]MDO9713911.1 NAD(P)-dependent oxidoreductase [Paracraurococcus sp. LOR1-02]
MRIGFVGLGNMGGPMCRNLVKGVNHEVIVHDLNAEAVRACTAQGATAADGLATLAASCEVVFTSLPTPQHVEMVAREIAAAARPGTVLFDLSTNSPTMVKRLHQELAARDITLLDTPVTGGVVRAVDASIVVMVGGDEAVFDQHRALLAAFSGTQVHVGPVGSASVAKLINNMLVLCNMAVAAEGMMIGAMAGIDLHKLTNIIQNGSGDSTGFRGLAARGLKGEFTPSFALDLAAKDLGLAVELAAEHGVPGLLAPQALALLRMARGLGYGQLDTSAMLKVYETMLGREVRLQ